MVKGGDDMRTVALEIQRLIDEEESGVLILVVRAVGQTPGRVGAKMVVLPDGSVSGSIGGGVAEARVIADSLNALEDSRGPRTIHYKLEELGVTGGGEMSVYLEPLVAPKRVILFGAGHVGAALARVLKQLGCRITVVDEREEWANRERFPDADSIVNRPYAEQIAGSPPGPKDHVVIATRGQEKDQLVLEGILDKRPVYLGVVTSRKRAMRAVELLRAKEFGEELISQIRIPAGLDVGAATPEEIAISITAELILFWRRGASALEALSSRSAVKESAKPPSLPGGRGKDQSLEELLFDDAEEEG